MVKKRKKALVIRTVCAVCFSQNPEMNHTNFLDRQNVSLATDFFFLSPLYWALHLYTGGRKAGGPGAVGGKKPAGYLLEI